MYFLTTNTIFFFNILAWISALTNAYNYCDNGQEKKLCQGKEGVHIVCHPDTVAQGGTLLALAPMTAALKRTILEAHNRYRDQLAGGEQEFKGGAKFPKATRMREVLWDDELAFIAGIHAQKCRMQHDKCRSSKRFMRAGQNLYWESSGKKIKNMLEKAEAGIDRWWIEWKLVDEGEKLVDSFPRDDKLLHDIGHFTAMANERSAFVGCAMALCEKCDAAPYCLEMTCDYSGTNVYGEILYKKGAESASECDYYDTKPHKKYKNLCKNTGKLFDKK